MEVHTCISPAVHFAGSATNGARHLLDGLHMRLFSTDVRAIHRVGDGHTCDAEKLCSDSMGLACKPEFSPMTFKRGVVSVPSC
jgi:hypothetical protein